MLKRTTKVFGKPDGFTLIEVIFTIIVIAVGVSALIFVLGHVAGRGINAEIQTTATMLAQEKLEQIIGDKRNPTPTWGYNYVITPGRYLPEPAVTGFTNYNRNVTITEVAASDLSTPQAGSGYAKIVVRVTTNTTPSLVADLTGLVTNY